MPDKDTHPKDTHLLSSSDAGLARVTEDLIELLIARGVIRFTDLPLAAQNKLLEQAMTARPEVRKPLHDALETGRRTLAGVAEAADIAMARGFEGAGAAAYFEGLTALYLQRVLDVPGLTVSRIASGLPVGGDLEYADELTLGRALEGRRVVGQVPTPDAVVPQG